MNNRLKKQILENTFVDQVRIQMKVNESEFNKLRLALNELAKSLKGSRTIDRELMLYLYSAPMMIRNAYESFNSQNDPPEIASLLENLWLELDELVTDCLTD